MELAIAWHAGTLERGAWPNNPNLLGRMRIEIQVR